MEKLKQLAIPELINLWKIGVIDTKEFRQLVDLEDAPNIDEIKKQARIDTLQCIIKGIASDYCLTNSEEVVRLYSQKSHHHACPDFNYHKGQSDGFRKAMSHIQIQLDSVERKNNTTCGEESRTQG